MGSFFGHGLEATFFILIGVWWMIHSFPAFIKARRHGGPPYRSDCSYPWPWIPQIPFEAIIKLSFPIIGFVCELALGGTRFVDSNDQFVRMDRLQHMSIYAMFTLYALVDLFTRLGAPLPRFTDWLSGALAFAWYGVCFTYHTLGEDEIGLDRLMHVLPIYTMYMLALAFFLECLKPSWFPLQMIRIYGTLVTGSWFWHTAVVMYEPFPYPGNQPNPAYVHDDLRNVQFVVAAFGFHLCVNAVIMLLFYAFCDIHVRNTKAEDYNHYGHRETRR